MTPKVGRKALGTRRKRGVGELGATVDDGDRIGRAAHRVAEKRRERRRFVERRVGAVEFVDDRFAFRIVEIAELPDRSGRLAGGRVEKRRQMTRKRRELGVVTACAAADERAMLDPYAEVDIGIRRDRICEGDERHACPPGELEEFAEVRRGELRRAFERRRRFLDELVETAIVEGFEAADDDAE